MSRYEKQQWLDDVEIQRKILCIVKEPQICFEPVKSLEELNAPDEKLLRLEKEKKFCASTGGDC